MRVKLLAMAVVLLGTSLGHRAQREADPRRRMAKEEWDLQVMPRAELIRAATMGHPLLVADILWVRGVLRFSDVYERPSEGDGRWLMAIFDAVTALDPSWRTAYFYGGSMLRVVGRIEDSDAIFERARQQPELADDPFFPFSLAMNAWLHHEDPEATSAYLLEAAKLPGAPDWYPMAAAGILDKERGAQAGIAMVEAQIQGEADPRVRGWLEAKLKRLRHDLFSEQVTAHYLEQVGDAEVRPGDPVEALPSGQALPPDPLGGFWLMGTDGVIRSDVAEGLRERQAVQAERFWLTHRRKTRPLEREQ